MPAALWLVVLPIGAVPVVYVFRRLRAGAIVAALIVLFLAWLAMKLPTGIVLNVLGRTVELDQLSQLTLALLFATTALLFLIVLTFSAARTGEKKESSLTVGRGQEGRVFYPVGLATLAFFVAASLSRHLGITAIFIEGAAVLTVFIIQGERLESTRAALRFLILMSLATPLFLLAARQIDLYQLSGEVARLEDLQQIILFIGVGFALWLALVPFHGWLTATTAESSPATAAFVLVVFPVVAMSTLIHLLIDFPRLADFPQLVRMMIVAGLVTASTGGLLASVQRGFSTLMGYAALYDLGCILAVVGVGGQGMLVVMLISLVVRALALTLLAASLSVVHLRTASDGFADMKGIVYKLPVATVGLLVGGLTLAGAPSTAGFVLRWQLLPALAEIDPRWPALIAFAGLGVAIGYLRGFRAMLAPGDITKIQKRQFSSRSLYILDPSLPGSLMIGLLGVLCILLGLFPALLIEPIQVFMTGIAPPIP